MGRAKPVELPSIRFEKQGDADEFFKEMLGRYLDGERVTGLDEVLLHELLLRHPDDKIRSGVEFFYRDRSQNHPTSCFHVVRADGERTDFSYPTCVRAKRPTVEEYFYRACRSAVSPYLTDVKNEILRNGPVRCSHSGELLTKENSEYRHTAPLFKELIKEFILRTGLVLTEELFVEDRDMQYIVRFKDVRLAGEFIEFHKGRAELALLLKGTR